MLKKFSKKTLLIAGAIFIVVVLRITPSHTCQRRQQMNPKFKPPLCARVI